MKKLILLFIFTYSIFQVTFGASGFNIKVRINNLSEENIFLGYHSGSKLFVIDTIKINNKGIGSFEGKEELKTGLYLIYLPNDAYIDFVIDKNQEFEIITDTADFVENTIFRNSEINSDFYDYQKFLHEKQIELKKLNDLKKDNENNAIKKNEIDADLKKLDNEVSAEMQRIIDKNNNNFLSTMLLATKDVKIPEISEKNSGNFNAMINQYHYYVKHFFDNIDFSEPGLLRTPFIENRIEQYFYAIPPIPDTLIPIIDTLIYKSKANDEMFQFIVSFLFSKFIKSNVMGMDKIYVHLGEKYYLSGEADWVDSTGLAKLAERIEKTKPNLLGAMAPNLKLETNLGEFVNLNEVDAKFLIIVFWEPNCGHCKIAIPKLHEIYKKYADKNIEVFAVYTQAKKEEWNEFIEKNDLDWINVYDPFYTSNFRDLYDIYSTPIIYLLDENKKIIAKRINVEDVEMFLERNL